MAKKGKSEARVEIDVDEELQRSVIFLSDSDEDEANEDLSLGILRRAREREGKRRDTDLVMARKRKSEARVEIDADEKQRSSVILLSGSDDDEASKDLSLGILRRGREREEKRRRETDLAEFKSKKNRRSADSIDPSSSSLDKMGIVANRSAEGVGDVSDAKKKNRRLKKKNKIEVETKEGNTIKVQEELNETVKNVETETFTVTNFCARGETLITAEAEDRKAVGMLVNVRGVEESLELGAIEMLDNVEKIEVKTPGYVEAIDAGVAVSDSAILRKLLRGPRYFDPPGGSNCVVCFNCNEEGHTAANCKLEKRKKPCFVCGNHGHSAKRCTQGQDCYKCKRRGHIAKDCHENELSVSQTSKICLRCGSLGHEMSSCRNDYASEDMKEIQCYVCRSYGHICCADILNSCPEGVSCYNCGRSGHSGFGCAKLRRETEEAATPTLCYKCGEEGHFARGCTKHAKSNGRRRLEPVSTPTKRFSKEGRDIDFLGSRSVPHFDKTEKKKMNQYEGRKFHSAGKSKRGGWITDDPGDFLNKRNSKMNGWLPPTSPAKRPHESPTSAAGVWHSRSQTPLKKHRIHPGTPSSRNSSSSHGSINQFQHGFTASRFGGNRGGGSYHGRSYNEYLGY